MIAETSFARLRNGHVVRRADVPRLPIADFRRAILAAVAEGGRVSALFGTPEGDGLALTAVVADDAHALLGVTTAAVDGASFPAITPECPQVHLFEREIEEQYGVVPEGHPWRKPVRFAPPLAAGAPEPPPIGVTDFYRVEGDEVHEVAVGPVHAGVIEPGHFRFQCHGEHVFHLEISLGYAHRGVERALQGGPNARSIHYAETLAGDTTIGHATAYCQAVEALSGARVPARAQALRGIALELERLASHTGDLGALAGDVGFLPTASYCGRLRGEFVNLSAEMCGSRFGRGLVRPGGAGFDVDPDRARAMVDRLDRALRDVEEAANLLWETPSVGARFESTGTVPAEVARELGLVGPAARAAGLSRDVRHDFPCGIFQFAHIPVSTWHTGDVFSRAYIRWLEIQRSVAFVRDTLLSLPAGPIHGEKTGGVPPAGPSDRRRGAPAAPSLAPDSLAVSLVEGWRGEICHVALTGPDGRFQRYKVVDPSFHNWMGLAMALRDQQISDFPLCNKSFDLSYCGHDL